VNWVYYPPIGHAIEGLTHAHRFLKGTPELEIGVLLPSSTGTELGECLPENITVYPIDLSCFAEEEMSFSAFRELPRKWDYMFTDIRLQNSTGWVVLDRCQASLREYVSAGITNSGWDCTGFPNARTLPLALQLPREAVDYANGFTEDSEVHRIVLLPGSGSGFGRTPSIPFWNSLITSLTESIQDVEIVLIGALAPGRSNTRGIAPEDVSDLETKYPNVKNAFDKGLLNQLALAARSDLCISPHSGMTFAIQCIGTPCLYLSGQCREYWFNGVPFVSIFPECDRYPCNWPPLESQPMHAIRTECIEREKAQEPHLCMGDSMLGSRIPDILRATKQLLSNELGFHDCLRKHQEQLVGCGECEHDEWPYDGGDSLLDPSFVFKVGGKKPI